MVVEILGRSEYQREVVKYFYQTYLRRSAEARGSAGFTEALDAGASDE
jgi:hypothetical protein